MYLGIVPVRGKRKAQSGIAAGGLSWSDRGSADGENPAMKLAFPLAAAAFLLAAAPCFALETVTLPQTNTDGTPQDTDATATANPSGFTSSQDKQDQGLLSQFHFSVSSQQGFFDQPNSWTTDQNSQSTSSAGYFDPNKPGSEFYNGH